MSVQSSCFAHVVAEVTAIRSGLTELLARLDQLESLLTTSGDTSVSSHVATESQLEDTIISDPMAQSQTGSVVSADEAISAAQTDSAMGRNGPDDTTPPDRPSAIVEALTEAMLPPEGIDPGAEAAETHSPAVADEVNDAFTVVVVVATEVSGIASDDTRGVTATMPCCETEASADDVDRQRASADAICETHAGSMPSADDVSDLTSDEGTADTAAPLPAVVAAQLADKAATIEDASPLAAAAAVPDSNAMAQPPASISTGLTETPPATSLVVLPMVGAKTRSTSRPGGRRIVAAIAASLIICVGAGAGYRLVDERWSDTLRIAVDETVRSLPALWQPAAAAHEANDANVSPQVRQD